MNILVTGLAGSGKSAVCDVLRDRGYYALNADFTRGCCEWIDTNTQQVTHYDLGEGYGKLMHVAWHWKKSSMVPLLERGMNRPEPRFFDGYAENLQEFYQYFDKMFLLVAGPATTTRRLLARTTGDWGKHPDDLRYTIECIAPYGAELTAAGAIVVDAEQSLDTVVAQILNNVSEE